MSAVTRYLKGGFAGAAARGISLAGGFASLWLFTHILTQEGYGQYVTAFAVAGFLARIAQLGLKVSTIERISSLSVDENYEDVIRKGSAAFSYTIVSSLIFAGVLFAAAPFLGHFLSGPDIIFWLRASVLFLPFLVLRPIAGGILRGLEKIPQALIVETILPQVTRTSLLLLTYLYGGGATLVVIVILASQALPLALFFAWNKFWRHLNFSAINADQWKFSSKLILIKIATEFLSRTDILFLSALAGAYGAGAYRIGFQIAMISNYGDSVLTNVIQPRISKYLETDRTEELLYEYGIVRDATVLAGAVVVLILIVFGKQLLGLFGEYQEQYFVLLLIATGYGMISTSFGSVGQLLLMDRQGNVLLIRSILVLGTNVLLNLLLIPMYGTLGAAMATVFASYLFANIYSAYLVRTRLELLVVDLRLFVLCFASLMAVVLSAFGVFETIYPSVSVVSIVIGYTFVTNLDNLTRFVNLVRRFAN